ncbi:AMP-binding protein [Rhodococcus sp. X156]|uniref:class I adenylate-forming enzyme family protein n=1 Tax=Rhodococcus sp. X156 TaxID=2499145 RepID=UPI0032178CF8
MTLLDMVAGVDPDRVAIGDRDTGLSLHQLRTLAGGAATLLADQPHRPLLFAGTATPAFPVALFGAALAGRSFAPISYRLAADPFAALVADQAPSTLLHDEPGAHPALPDDVAVVGAAAFLQRAGGAAEWTRDADQDPEQAAVLLHTSGTTGKPKVAVLRHRHLVSYVLNTTELLSAGPEEAALVSVPPYHVAGVAGLLTGVYCGRRIVQLPNFEAAAWVDLALAQDVTHAMVVPTMLARIVEVLEARGSGLPALRHLSYGGGRMPRPVIERALRLLPDVSFVNAYGLTETTSSVAVLGPDDHRAALASADPAVRRRLESVGRPLPGVEIVVRDPHGAPVAATAAGELWVRGEQVSGEYSAASVTDDAGWFPTRDGGWIDDQGYVFVAGRLDDVIVRGGENLSPGEIEDVLARHPAVGEVAVYGVPDEQWGEVPVAAVVLRAGAALDAEQAQRWVAEHLRSSRVPARIHFLAGLPRNDMGKLLRRVLKAESAAPTSAAIT